MPKINNFEKKIKDVENQINAIDLKTQELKYKRKSLVKKKEDLENSRKISIVEKMIKGGLSVEEIEEMFEKNNAGTSKNTSGSPIPEKVFTIEEQ